MQKRGGASLLFMPNFIITYTYSRTTNHSFGLFSARVESMPSSIFFPSNFFFPCHFIFVHFIPQRTLSPISFIFALTQMEIHIFFYFVENFVCYELECNVQGCVSKEFVWFCVIEPSVIFCIFCFSFVGIVTVIRHAIAIAHTHTTQKSMCVCAVFS